jgi:Amt family ammonium transporter
VIIISVLVGLAVSHVLERDAEAQVREGVDFEKVEKSPPDVVVPKLAAAPAHDDTSLLFAVNSLFMMAAAALTLVMVPALGLFYGGMVRRKNVLATFQNCLILLGFTSVAWVLFGYSVAFGQDVGLGLAGGFQFAMLIDVGLAPDARLAAGVPHQLFMTFQMMVAVFTVALISGAVVERVKFSSYLIFATLWSIFVYAPVAHWVWAPDGWIHRFGALDFGGGLVVHLTSGLTALCWAIVLGKRKGLDTEDMHPHNLTLTALGTGLLWFGWLGLTVGHAHAVGTAAAAAFVASNLGAAASIVTWSTLEYIYNRKVTVLGTCTAAIAGLVAVAAPAGYVGPLSALFIGGLVGPLCHGAILIKSRLGYDDSLDVFAVHGVGGAAGMLAVGFLASPILSESPGGLIYGTTDLILSQLLATLAVGGYTIVASLAILLLVDRTAGLRVSQDDEDLGLDLTQHGQRGYIMGEGELIGIMPR